MNKLFGKYELYHKKFPFKTWRPNRDDVTLLDRVIEKFGKPVNETELSHNCLWFWEPFPQTGISKGHYFRFKTQEDAVLFKMMFL